MSPEPSEPFVALQRAYDALLTFASEGALAAELHVAKAEYLRRTGEMFTTDPACERRLAAFLEWYVLDRPTRVAPLLTPAQRWIAAQKEAGVPAATLAPHRALASSWLSLFEYRGVKGDRLIVVDLFTAAKQAVYERRRPAGLERGDIFEGRLVQDGGQQIFTEAFDFVPRAARRPVLSLMRAARKQGPGDAERIDLVHRVAYFSHRCERYQHVDPRTIFADLARPTPPTPPAVPGPPDAV